MQRYILSPEVPGGHGDGTEFIRQENVPVGMTKFHVEFDDWLGDCLLEVDPGFLILKAAANALTEVGTTGFELRPVKVTRSDLFFELNDSEQLPEFLWLYVKATDASADIYLAADGRIVVSETVFKILKENGLEDADPVCVTK